MPVTTMPAETSYMLVPALRRESITMPTTRMAMPAIGYIRYLPVRVIMMPEVMDEPTRPSISGTSQRPETVAESPLTIWR